MAARNVQPDSGKPTGGALRRKLAAYRQALEALPPNADALEKVLADLPQKTTDDLIYLHVLAPVMTAYTRWVLTRAKAAGIRRLYFLARDAWPMYLAAKAFCEAGLYDLDCRYLKVSRYALRLPAYHLAGDACVDQIFLGVDAQTENVIV